MTERLTEKPIGNASPQQLRKVDAPISWAPSPSPFGCEGLLSMEMGSPFQLFSPIVFETADAENSDSISIFSPSMFSPSKSEISVTSRLISAQKRNMNSMSIPLADDDLAKNANYFFSLPNNSSSHMNDENYSMVNTSNTFRRAIYSAPSSSNYPRTNTGTAPSLEDDCKASVEASHMRSSFFSPGVSVKPQASGVPSSTSSSQGFVSGIAEIGAGGDYAAKLRARDRRDRSESVHQVTDKLDRGTNIDDRISHASGCTPSQSRPPSRVMGRKVPDVPKNLLLSSAGPTRSAYASPAVSNPRDPTQLGYAESMPVTPSQCKCKKTKCLKLYCDCFALLKFCGPNCGCTDCHNDLAHEEIRRIAIVATMQRTATAFTSKVTPTSSHVAGCNCSKSNCLKKYCECFLGGATCGASCKCQSCKNYPGSEALAVARNPESSSLHPGSSSSSSSSKALKDAATRAKYSSRAYEADEPYTAGPRQLKQESYDASSESLTPSMDISLSRVRSADVSMSGEEGVDDEIACSQWDAQPVPADSAVSAFDATNKALTVSRGHAKERAVVSAVNKPGAQTRSSRHRDGQSIPAALRPVSELFTLISPEPYGTSYGRSDHSVTSALRCIASSPSVDSDRTPSLSTRPCTTQPSSSSSSSSSSSLLHPEGADDNTLAQISSQQQKRRRLNETKIVYPYFGSDLPHAPKMCALRCLEYLDGKDFYSVSVLNQLWCKTSMDSALWE